VDESEQVEIGHKQPRDKKRGPSSPAPGAGSDSDVRLVSKGSNVDFQITGDSNVKMVEDPGPTGPKSGPKSGSGKPKKPETGVRKEPQEPLPDSGVKMVGDVAEESVPLGQQPPKTASDSDIRIDFKGMRPGGGAPDEHDMLLTEEIDLDAELRKAEEEARSKDAAKARSRRKTQQPQLPTTSPFELSDADLGVAGAAAAPGLTPESSSDFDLSLDAPAAPPSPKSDEIPLDLGGEHIEIGEVKPATGRESGINLQPNDSGISLEGEGAESGDNLEFELSLDAESTPQPAQAGQQIDSSSEFELSLDDEPASGPVAAPPESDSEFELTLDESGELAPLDEDKPAADASDKDIFETDFEVPALEDESGSGAVALESSDTDLESSDFDLALGEEDIAAEESGSQVVALEDEEEADEGAATVERPTVALEDEEEVDQLLDEEEPAEEEEEGRPARRKAAAAVATPTPWGPLPAIFLIPCAILLLLGGLMGFELIRGMWGYRESNKFTGMLIDPIARMFASDDLPKK
jgi:hypothetical protein